MQRCSAREPLRDRKAMVSECSYGDFVSRLGHSPNRIYDQPHLGHFGSPGGIIVWQEGHSRKSSRSDSFCRGWMRLHLGHSFWFHSSYERGRWHLGQRYDINSKTSKAVMGKKMPPMAHANALRF